MDNYENLGLIGEGAYGTVFKARNKSTGVIVAIKKFKDTDENESARKTSMREVRILKQIHHENIVSLVEVFRRKNRVYLVFDFVERSILQDIEQNPHGMDPNDVRKCMYQLFQALKYCHSHSIIHRDIKPENMLISSHGVVKLCDFGFARTVVRAGGKYTEYVATRWYRSPELLCGDSDYTRSVDIWAAGCLLVEMLTGQPLFPGDSDIDTLHLIIRMFGPLPERFSEAFNKNPLYTGVKLPDPSPYDIESIEKKFPSFDNSTLEIIKKCLRYNPDERLDCDDLLKLPYFSSDFIGKFQIEFTQSLALDRAENTVDLDYVLANSEEDLATNASPVNINNYPINTEASSQGASPKLSSSPKLLSISPSQSNIQDKTGVTSPVVPSRAFTLAPIGSNAGVSPKIAPISQGPVLTSVNLNAQVTNLNIMNTLKSKTKKNINARVGPSDSDSRSTKDELDQEDGNQNQDTYHSSTCVSLPQINQNLVISPDSPKAVHFNNSSIMVQNSYDFELEKLRNFSNLCNLTKANNPVYVKYTDWSTAVFKNDDSLIQPNPNVKKKIHAINDTHVSGGYKFKQQIKVKSSSKPISTSAFAYAVTGTSFNSTPHFLEPIQITLGKKSPKGAY